MDSKEIANALAEYILAEHNRQARVEELNHIVWDKQRKIETMCKEGQIQPRCLVAINGVDYIVTIKTQAGGQTYAEQVERYE